MADKKISDLSATSSVASGDLFEMENAGGNSRKITGQNLATGLAALAVPAVVLISEQSPSGTGTVTFSSIAATYRDLRVVVRGRSTAAATAVNVNMRFNSDSGSNYDWERLSGGASTASASPNAAVTEIQAGGIAGASSTANVADVVECFIADYRGTTFHKSAITNLTIKTGSTTADLNVGLRAGWWRNTAAITTVDIILSSGNFVSGSVVSLYGLM